MHLYVADFPVRTHPYMANVAKLKDTARSLEQRGQWEQALELYERLLTEAGDDPETGLLNRLGDIYMRLGDVDRAVEAYERAVAAYHENGLTNNAIALCRKILRAAPGRSDMYLRLGQLSAEQGFMADARDSFLEFADRARQEGRTEASFAALKEFADLSPHDTETRSVLAEQLYTHGYPDEAVEQLRFLLAALSAQGDEAAMEGVRARIHEIDPDAETTALGSPLRAEGHTPEPQDDMAAGLLPTLDGTLDDALETGTTLEGIAPTAIPDEEPGEDVPVLDGLQITHHGESWEEEEAEPEGDVEPLPLLGTDEEAELEIHPGQAEEIDAEPLPLLSAADEEFEGWTIEPSSDMPEEVDSGIPAEIESSIEALRRRVAEQPDDVAAREELLALLLDRGENDQARHLLEEAHRSLAGQGRYVAAIEALRALHRLSPRSTLLYQKQVEYAFRSGERDHLIQAYLDLGGHLQSTGDDSKAIAVYKRVAELDPSNPEARERVRPASPASSAPTPPPAPPAAPESRTAPEGEGEYFDLASFIFEEDEIREPTTRFVVPDEEPSGDEDRDFADMLARFRHKVAENIDVEDSNSHYDLGLAFKDMGLLDEAIAQLQVALRGGANPLATLEVLGECFVEKEQYTLASRVLERALKLEAGETELVGVYYLLGRCREMVSETSAACEFYERVLALDIRFRDAGARVERLRESRGV